jgi:hypothetical protein
VTDTGFSGTWSRPTVTTIKINAPTAPAKYHGRYVSSSGSYTGTLILGGVKYPGTTLTPGATAGC